MRKFSKVLSLILAFVLIIPGFTFAEGQPTVDSRELEVIERALENYGDIINPSEAIADVSLDEVYNEDDEVRIIVELESDPAIVYANERGISFESVNESIKDNLYNEINAEQNRVKSQINSAIDMDYINNFNTVFNGFSGIVRFSDIESIRAIPSVREVYISNEYEKPEPIEKDMLTSHDMINSYEAWALEYKGEGTTIAILDTGIDYRHRDMVLSEETETEHNEDSINALISEHNLPGKYFTDKVPFGYNYYDMNNQVIDIGPGASMHGMHVAGTAAANGDVKNGGIKGVAPEAQLLAMKVFSNDPLYSTTFGDVYLVAMDHSAKLGAEVVNMSLGSTASFFKPGNPEDIAITNAVNNGVVVTISAGNSGSMTYGLSGAPNYGLPWVENPDIGVVGSPSLNTDSLSVASVENTHYPVNQLTYKVNGETKQIGMMISGDLEHSDIIKDEVEFVECGLGYNADFEGKDLTGKVALIQRGDITFGEKIENAQKVGAIGVIIYNTVAGGDALQGMSFGTSNVNVPAGFIGLSNGLILKDLQEKKVSFPAEKINLPNPSGGKMSDFTSWGTTPSLELKPEITAPGGEIYSTLNNDKYGMMSGTSMAAPHAAGGSALVMQYIKSHAIYKDLSLGEQARLAKVLLMNTANPIIDQYGVEYSPRRQGAGLMDLYGAVTTQVRVVNADANEAKIELKDFEETSFTMNFKAINDSLTPKKYNIDTTVLSDYNMEEGDVYLNTLTSDYLDNTSEYPESLTIPANGEATFSVTVDFGENESIYRNMFIEGWVKLVDPSDNNDTLVVPFVGFYGDWNEPKVLDNMIFIDPVGSSYFNQSGFLRFNSAGKGYYYSGPQNTPATNLLMNPGQFSAELNGTGEIMPYLSFLRNALKVDYRITDKDGKVLTTVLKRQETRKNYSDGSKATVGMINAATWDGTVKGQVVPDGDYFYEIATTISYPGAEPQVKKVPITIDTVGPEITNAKFDPTTNKLTWTAKDKIKIAGFDLYVNGEYIESVDGVHEKEDYDFTFSPENLKSLGENIIEIAAVDELINVTSATVGHVTDNDSPFIYLYSPDLLEAYKNDEILVSNPDQVLELPDNSVIIRDKAYDRHYLATDTQAQLNLIFAYNLDETAYIKLDSDTIATIEGDTASFYDVPEYVRYYDAEGNITDRKVQLEPEEVVPAGVPLTFEGYVTNFVALDRVEIDGIEADIEYISDIQLPDTAGQLAYSGPAYKFTKTIYFEDGYHEISIKAISKAGQEDSIVRRIWVDDTSATLELTVLEREVGSAIAEIEVYMADNLGYLELYMDGSNEFLLDKKYNSLNTGSSEATHTLTVELEEGDNTFTFWVFDLAGNRTEKEITITRIIE